MTDVNFLLPLTQMQADVYDCNVSNGWFDSGRSLGTDLALLHSEVSEMFEAFRDWGLEDATKVSMPGFVDPAKIHELSGGVAGEVASVSPPLPKPEGVGSEAADVLIRWLDHAHRHGFDVMLAQGQAFEMDWAPVQEFGDWIALLHRAIADMEGSPICQPFTAYCAMLSILYAGCGWYGIDLEAEYTRKLAFNRTRGYKHGGKSV